MTKHPKKVQIIEVGPRDGLQNESQILSVQDRFLLIKKLVAAGAERLELGAFVSPKWVPQMAQTEELLRLVRADGQLSVPAAFRKFSVLVPNAQGMEKAIESGIREVAIFGACSETFSKKNINCTIQESFARFAEIMPLAKRHKIRVRGYLSTAFGCPYEGEVSEARVVELTKKMKSLGVFEVSIGDTIGVAGPNQVDSLVKRLKRAVGVDFLALHFHDTRGTALANVLKSLELGVHVFDSSVGGLGGCPYAKGASGNVATEDLQYMFLRMGIKTGLDLDRLAETAQWLEILLNKPLPSKISKVRSVLNPLGKL